MLRQHTSMLTLRKELTVLRCMCKSVEQKESYIKRIAANQSDKNEKPAGWDSAKPYSDIPGPKPIPVLGNAWRYFPKIGTYSGDRVAQPGRLYAEFGPLHKQSELKFRTDMLMLFDPESIEMLYRNEGVWPKREGLDSLDYYKLKIRKDIFKGQGGLLTSHGEEWYYTRSVINPAMMQPRSAQLYIDSIDAVGLEFMDRIKSFTANHPQGEMPEDFSNELNKWALETICVIGLNKRLGLLNPNLAPNSGEQMFIKDVLSLFQLINELDLKFSLWKWISTPKWKKFVKTMDRVTNFQKKHLDEAIEQFEKSDKKDLPQSELSILEQLLKRDKKVAFAMVFDMLFAGIDTTSKTVAATLYFLCKNQNTQKKLREELQKVLSQKDTPITKELLNNMPYLRAVIKESTRIAPVAPENMRRTVKDLVLAGYQVPKGVDVLVPHMHLCQQEKYFAKADQFIPERWLRDGSEEYAGKEAHPFVMMPFGFGPRSCVGRRLAQLEIEIMLARTLRNFAFTWPHAEMKWAANLIHGVGSPLKYHVKAVQD